MSEQISTAGTEASGTGNIELALNGALTIGTLDGANVEIREQVGADNIFIFGHTTGEVAAIRSRGYQPRALYEHDERLKAVLDAIRDGTFSADESARYQAIFDALVNWGDHYLLLADFASYLGAQARVDQLFRDQTAWARRSLLNIAAWGRSRRTARLPSTRTRSGTSSRCPWIRRKTFNSLSLIKVLDKFSLG